ncbi:MAG: hypothetical protein R3D80_04995 [Paracoccaceae bacterium]
MPLLSVRNLTVDFATTAGPFRAVEGVDVTVDAGDKLAIVGESARKSVAMLAVMGLLPWTATITADEMSFEGYDIRTLTPKQRRKLIGRDMAMIFQERCPRSTPASPSASRSGESLKKHTDPTAPSAARAVELLDLVGIPPPRPGSAPSAPTRAA